MTHYVARALPWVPLLVWYVVAAGSHFVLTEREARIVTWLGLVIALLATPHWTEFLEKRGGDPRS